MTVHVTYTGYNEDDREGGRALDWVTVTNDPPEEETEATGEEVRLFQEYIGNKKMYPFRHQYQAFQLLRNGEECVLVAGTAAGKTLAVVIPLLLRIKKGSSQKVLFLYPTLALLEDQLETIRKVAALIGYEDQIGYIFGGMSRWELISQITKPILVATPDAVYWFVEKNVKYSSVLFYSLCHVDDIVVDEAHLLSGLMGYNLKSFLDRIQEIRLRFLNRNRMRIHVLTATPTDVVHRLSGGKHILGRSKVGNVLFRSEPQNGNDSTYWGNLLSREASGDFQRMILVMNSAKRVHQIFYDCTEQSNTEAEALKSFYKPFGQVAGQDVIQAMKDLSIDRSLIQKWMEISTENVRILFKMLPDNMEIRFTSAFLSDLGADVIGNIISEVRTQAETFFNKRHSNTQLSFKPAGKLYKHYHILQKVGALSFDLYKQTIESYGYELQSVWDQYIQSLAQDAEEVAQAVVNWKTWFHQMNDSHLLTNIASEIERKLMNSSIPFNSIKFDIQQDILFSLPSVSINELVEECQNLGIPFGLVFEKLSNDKKIRIHHIRLLKGTTIPVILYTGSMTKRARKGLIQAFQSKEAVRAILISTSAVEAGVDFDADLLITEKCTGSSFLQRFGRVGRRSQGQNRVILVTRDGTLLGRLRETFEDKSSCNREEFSKLMTEILPKREYLNSSPYLEVLQANVTRRLGEIGQLIAPVQSNLERLLLEKGGFRYGLRSTLPQIELLDRGIVREPFQALAQITQNQLYVENGSFVVAKAQLYFDELIYLPWKYDVYIDQDKTFFNMRLLLYWYKGALHGIEASPFRQILLGNEHCYSRSLHWGLNKFEVVKKFLESGKSQPEMIRQILPYLYAVQENPHLNQYILGIGDVFLLRGTDGSDIKEIIDAEAKEIILRNQMFLIQPRNNDKNFDEYADYWKGFEQELHVQSFEDYGKWNNPIGHIAVERVAGACAELYRRLVKA